LLAERPAIDTPSFKRGGSEVIAVTGHLTSSADVEETIAIARERRATWIILDGYRFDSDAYRTVREQGFRLLVIDDNGGVGHYACDAVVNPNVHAHRGLYGSRATETVLLLGPAYALLRPEFQRWRDWTREHAPQARRLLVTLGAGASVESLRSLIERLGPSASASMHIRVVVGPFSGVAKEPLDDQGQPSPGVEWVCAPSDMPSLMAWADVAVASSGGTAQEMAFMGLPAVLLVVADNQAALAAALERAGAAVNLAKNGGVAACQLQEAVRDLVMDEPRRRHMSQCGRALLDGGGAARVAAFIAEGVR
jgi:spore coat polysaccharide biosynthesis predicted glycosyltransferase SpsG